MAFYRHQGLGPCRRLVVFFTGEDVYRRSSNIRKLVSPFRPVPGESDELRSNFIAIQVPPHLQAVPARYCSPTEVTSRCMDESLACNII